MTEDTPWRILKLATAYLHFGYNPFPYKGLFIYLFIFFFFVAPIKV